MGVVFYEASTGMLPFRGKTTFEVSAAIMNEMPPAPPGWMPPGLWAIVMRCLAKDPAQRYQRASEVQAALEAVQSAAMAAPPAAASTSTPSPDIKPLHTVLRGM